MSKEVIFGEKHKELINKDFDVTLDVFEGTPRSGKTTVGVFRCARYLVESRDQNHLVVGYNQEQAFRLFLDADGLGLIHIFMGFCKLKSDRFGDHLEIDTPRGVKKVYYKGGGKRNDYKKIQGMSLGSVWFMEINLLDMGMIQECFRRTFAALDRYHFADLNPPSPQHPVIKEVFGVQDTRLTHWTIKDNPIISKKRREEIKNTLKKNDYLYKRDWLGLRVLPRGLIYSVFDEERNVSDKIEGNIYEMYFSGDSGQQDATSVSCNIVTYVKGKGFRLNRVANYYHSGRDGGEIYSNSRYAREIKKFIEYCVDKFERNYTYIFIDPASLSLREELREVGIGTERADNNRNEAREGKGSGIETGIERVQNTMTEGQFVLVDREDILDEYGSYNFRQELGLYARDDKGKIISGNDHSLDELRYSVNYFYKQYVL